MPLSPERFLFDPSLSYDQNLQAGPSTRWGGGLERPLREPSHEVMGRQLVSRLGGAAGPLLDSRYVDKALGLGLGFAVYKTVRSGFVPSQSLPNFRAVHIEPGAEFSFEMADNGVTVDDEFDETALSSTNSYGVPSSNPELWQPDLARAISKAKDGQLVIASVQGTKRNGASEEDFYNDWAKTAQLAVEAGAKAIEMNLSCPNQVGEGILCADAISCGRSVEAVRSNIPDDIDLIIKIVSTSPSQTRDLIAATGSNVQAVAANNTIRARTLNAEGKPAFGDGREFTGVGGAAVHNIALDTVRTLDAVRREGGFDYSIIGIGGVVDSLAYTNMRLAGADLVATASGLVVDPRFIHELGTYYPNSRIEENVLNDLREQGIGYIDPKKYS